MNAIFKRRSVRKYTNQQVTDEQVEQILRAAMAAPSARNTQPWEFIVVRDKDTFAKIMLVHPYSSMLNEASIALIVCGDEDKDIIKGTGYWVQSCSASVENILIQSADMGLGSVWLGVYPREERIKGLRDIFDLPPNIIPLAIISIGYPAEDTPPSNRFDKNRIHFEKW